MLFDVEWCYVYGTLLLSPGSSHADDLRSVLAHRQKSCHSFGHVALRTAHLASLPVPLKPLAYPRNGKMIVLWLLVGLCAFFTQGTVFSQNLYIVAIAIHSCASFFVAFYFL